MFLIGFFQKYFVEPIDLGTGYNSINTLVYALLFVFFTYLIYKFLEKLKIKPDKRFSISVIPWVIFGIFIRVIEDSGIIGGYLFVTPNIWFLFLGMISLMLISSRLLEKKIGAPYFKIMFLSGTILSAILLPFLKIVNFQGLVHFLLWFLPWILVLRVIKWPKENKLVLLSQLFDAIATFVSLQYFGYFEQHVLPRIIIESTGTPFSFVIVKLVVVVGVLKILDKYSDDIEFTNYLKFIIALLGFITGLRDLLRLILLV